MPGGDKRSEKEERVLALVVKGKTNKEITPELNLSDKTVKNYLTNVFKELQIARRAQAVPYSSNVGPNCGKLALSQ